MIATRPAPPAVNVRRCVDLVWSTLHAGPLSIAALYDRTGLSQRVLIAVLVELQRRGLVRFDDDVVMLASEGDVLCGVELHCHP